MAGLLKWCGDRPTLNPSTRALASLARCGPFLEGRRERMLVHLSCLSEHLKASYTAS